MTNIYFICCTNGEALQTTFKQPVRRKQLHAVKAKKIFGLKKSFVVVVSRIFDSFQPGVFPHLCVLCETRSCEAAVP